MALLKRKAVDVLRQVWTADAPVDHQGTYYRIQGASPAVQTVQRPRIPIYFGGASDAAIRVAGRHANIYALWDETRAQVAEIISRVRVEAAKHGRQVRFSLSFRPILGVTEDEAWARAEAILARTLEVRGEAALGPAIGSRGNTMALVGTPQQVAEAFLDYHALGVTTFLIRGFDPLGDALEYGRTRLWCTDQIVDVRR